MKTHYDTLGVPRTASHRDIRKAYRKLAVTYHPDKHHGDTRYESLLKEINIAYETLSDPQSREAYDFTLSNGDAQFTRPESSERYGYSQRPTTHQQPSGSIPNSSFERIKSAFFFFIVVVVILWLLSSLTNTESPNDPNRPKSGELNFNNSK